MATENFDVTDRRLHVARIEKFRVELLDRHDNLKRDLVEFRGGSWEINTNATIKGGGKVEISRTSDERERAIDFGSDRLKIWYEANGLEWPLGVFLIEAPEDIYDDQIFTINTVISLMDKLAILDQQELSETYSARIGRNVVDEVAYLIRSTGETAINIELSSETVRTEMSWEAGTTILKVCNDLLASINYWGLRASGHGVIFSRPYRKPQSRPITYVFETGENSVHLAEWSRVFDWYGTPNQVVQVSQGDDEKPGLIGIAQNNDPDSPYSIPARGRIISMTETGVEATSQRVIDELAQRRLLDQSSPVSNITVDHALMPLEVDDRVQLRTPTHLLDATITKMSINLQPGSLVSAEWREISLVNLT